MLFSKQKKYQTNQHSLEKILVNFLQNLQIWRNWGDPQKFAISDHQQGRVDFD